ncbi:unnamed protein product [Urochloa humidicola]
MDEKKIERRNKGTRSKKNFTTTFNNQIKSFNYDSRTNFTTTFNYIQLWKREKNQEHGRRATMVASATLRCRRRGLPRAQPPAGREPAPAAALTGAGRPSTGRLRTHAPSALAGAARPPEPGPQLLAPPHARRRAVASRAALLRAAGPWPWPLFPRTSATRPWPLFPRTRAAERGRSFLRACAAAAAAAAAACTDIDKR